MKTYFESWYAFQASQSFCSFTIYLGHEILPVALINILVKHCEYLVKYSVK